MSKSSSLAESLIAQGVNACKSQDFAKGFELIDQAITLQPDNWRYHYILGAMLESVGQLQHALDATINAAKLNPDEPDIWAAMAELWNKAENPAKARQCHEKVLTLRPDDRIAEAAIWKLNRKEVKGWHFSMMNDMPRNAAYENAIGAFVKDKIVLEVGAGSGLLSMMAARAGAKHVYTCEMVPVIARKAQEIIAVNGLSDKITLIPKISYDVQLSPEELPEKADVLVTETFDPNLIGEHVLAIVADAKKRLLKPDAVIIPAKASLMGLLVDSNELQEQTSVEEICGFDLSAFNEFKVRPGIVVTANNYDFTPLSDVFPIAQYDFMHGDISEKDVRVTIPIKANGTCHGILSWLRLEMGNGSVYEAPPLDNQNRPKLHWLHALHCWDKAKTVKAEEILTLHGRFTPKQFVFSLK